jgi:hypothetical protein
MERLAEVCCAAATPDLRGAVFAEGCTWVLLRPIRAVNRLRGPVQLMQIKAPAKALPQDDLHQTGIVVL